MSKRLPYATAPRLERIRSAYKLAREGLGWEDIVVRSRGWPCGEISRAVAWTIVEEVQGNNNA